MTDLLARLKGHSLLRFLAVGVLNTLLSAVIMFVLYDGFHLGYWLSSAVSYAVGAVVSFFLNRRFTFKSDAALLPAALRFALTVAVCYLIAYSLAKPLILALFSGMLSPDWAERLAMVTGMVLYTALNYAGQKLFAFRRWHT